MDLTLHIGPHKTGTTAIQTAFAKGATALRRRGILYPKCNWTYPAQHNLAFAMKGKINPSDGHKPDIDVELEALRRALERARSPRVFLSSEEFFACPIDMISKLKERLAVTSTTIIAYPRRQDSFLISCHNQKIKQAGNGYTAPIARFLKEPRKITPEIDYLACISAWADVFGDENMLLHPFEGGSPLDHLKRYFGVNDLLQNTSQNESVPGVVAEVMRLAKMQKMATTKQRKLLAKASTAFAGYPPLFVPDEARLQIIKTFEPDNTALFERFGQPNPYTAAAYQPQNPPSRDKNINLHDLVTLIGTLL